MRQRITPNVMKCQEPSNDAGYGPPTMPIPNDLPRDWPDRLRAGMAYADMTFEQLEAALNLPGAKRSALRNWANGRNAPQEIARRELMRRLAAATRLPEAFFWGRPAAAAEMPPEADRQVSALLDELRLIRAETAARDAEVLKRIEGLQRSIRELQRPPQQ